MQSRRDLYYSPDLKLNLLTPNFHLHEMSNCFCLVISAVPGVRELFFWVTSLCKSALKMGVQVALWLQVATCIQLRCQNERKGLNNGTEGSHIAKYGYLYTYMYITHPNLPSLTQVLYYVATCSLLKFF